MMPISNNFPSGTPLMGDLPIYDSPDAKRSRGLRQQDGTPISSISRASESRVNLRFSAINSTVKKSNALYLYNYLYRSSTTLGLHLLNGSAFGIPITW